MKTSKEIIKAEKLKKPRNPNNGGKRPGAGRKPGGHNASTLQKLTVLEAFNQRTMQKADELFNLQYSVAKGSTYMYRIDEYKDKKGRPRKKHILVTDPDEIKQALDEGLVDGENYYYITTKDPDTIAIDSLLNRAFGKAVQALAGTLKFRTISDVLDEIDD